MSLPLGLQHASRLCGLSCLVAALVGCGDATPTPVAPLPTSSSSASASASVAALDPLGPPPSLAAPRAFVPQAPLVSRVSTDQKASVALWHVLRPSLPMVSMTLSIAVGSADDPVGQEGLAHAVGDMLDEGAGKRTAVELSQALEDLGATFDVSVSADATTISLTVLEKSFPEALALVADVVLRPTFPAAEWKRVQKLWENDLVQRAKDPVRVSRLVMARAQFGDKHPYGHLPEGRLAYAKKAKLSELVAFHRARYRPGATTVAIAGNLTQARASELLAQALNGWREPAKAPARASLEPLVGHAAPAAVLVDRPGAPQSVVALVGPGVAAADGDAPLLDLVNTALGGSFTSRLNQNLREEKGWTYGARSGFTEARGRGVFLARAEVEADKTLPALREIVREVGLMRDAGLTQAELTKVLAQDRAELVRTYETVTGTSARLAGLASLGLDPTFDGGASAKRQAATLTLLEAAAKRALAPAGQTRVVVGPLKALGLSQGGGELPDVVRGAVVWDAEGEPVPALKP